jgi:hypothetical protein
MFLGMNDPDQRPGDAERAASWLMLLMTLAAILAAVSL